MKYSVHLALFLAILANGAADIWFSATDNKPTFTLLLMRYVGMAVFLSLLLIILRQKFRYLFYSQSWVFALFGVAAFTSGWLLTDFSGSVAYSVLGVALLPVVSFSGSALYHQKLPSGGGLISAIFLSAIFVAFSLESFDLSRIEYVWMIGSLVFAVSLSMELWAIRRCKFRAEAENLPHSINIHALLAACLLGMTILIPVQAALEIYLVPGAMEFSRFFEIDWEVYRLVPFLIAAAIIMNLTMMWATSKLEGSIHPEVILQSAVLAIVAERIFVTEITSLNDVAPVAAGVLSLFGFSVLYVFKTKRT